MGWADDFAEGFAAGFVPAYEKSFEQEVKRQDTLYESAIERWGETQAERAEAQREHAQRLRRAETVAQDLGVDTGLVFRQADTFGWDFAKAREAIEERGVQRIGGNDTQTDAAMSESDTQGGSSTFDIETFRARMRQSESSGDTGAYRQNEDGRTYAGLVQMGEARLKDYNNATGAGLTPESYRMMNEDAQREVENWHFRDINQRINSEGLDEYIGQTINGTRITRDSIVAMSHLGGFNGAKKYLESGGEQNPSDELGTSLSDYASKFGQPADDASAQTDDMLSGSQESSPGITREEALQYVNTGNSVVDQRIVNSLDQRGELEAFVQSARGEPGGMEVPETNFRLGSANNSDYELSDFVGKTPAEIQQLVAVYGSSMTDEDRVVVDSIMEVAQQEENDSDWWRKPEEVSGKSSDFLRTFVALTDNEDARENSLKALEARSKDDVPTSAKDAAFTEYWTSLPDKMSSEERGQAAVDFENTWSSATGGGQMDIFAELAERDSLAELTALRTVVNNDPSLADRREQFLNLIDTALDNQNAISEGGYTLDDYRADLVKYTSDLTTGSEEERQAASEWFSTEQPGIVAGLKAAEGAELDIQASSLVDAGVPEEVARLAATDSLDFRANRFGQLNVYNTNTGEIVSQAETRSAAPTGETRDINLGIPTNEDLSDLSDEDREELLDQLSAQAQQEMAALEETLEGGGVETFQDTLASIDVSAALGGPGKVQSGVNTVAAIFGANAPFAENRRAANALERLQRVTALTMAQAQANQRGSVTLMNEFRANAVGPNELIGIDGALDKFKANYNIINDRVRKMREIGSGRGRYDSKEVTRANLIAEDLTRLRDYYGVLVQTIEEDVPEPSGEDYIAGSNGGSSQTQQRAEPTTSESANETSGGAGRRERRTDTSDQQSVLQQARDAISEGADPEAVRQRLIDNGYDPSGL